ncbi:MAG: thioredoxin family protein [Gammaproteobacteria bacterium]|jgi:glutaredoxin
MNQRLIAMRNLLFVLAIFVAIPALADDAITWTSKNENDETKVHLYFFWSQSCPHCRKALPFIDSISRDYPWFEIHSAEVSQNRKNLEHYIEMAASLEQEASSVPAFFICGKMVTGYDSPQGTGQAILDLANRCRHSPATAFTAIDEHVLHLPFLGTIDPEDNSLPVFTMIIAGMDSFNPCAFFVLLFLLSLMAHARSRARMLITGITFVSISALIYFLFMAAWLNLFMMIGAIPVITIIAGMVAVIIGAINIKDYFIFRQGPSLSIPESAKPTLFHHMRDLLKANSITTVLLGTSILAIAANSYELLCTAGFPMVYTRLLTLNELGNFQYYAYLVLYNLIYVLPLLVIVVIFSFTLGAHKLSEQQGRFLKLLSGSMMLGLGLVMLFKPGALVSSIWPGFILLLSAMTIAIATHLLSKKH